MSVQDIFRLFCQRKSLLFAFRGGLEDHEHEIPFDITQQNLFQPQGLLKIFHQFF